MRGRLVHDGTLRRVSGVSGGARDDSPGNAATAESFFHFVASRMRFSSFAHVGSAHPGGARAAEECTTLVSMPR